METSLEGQYAKRMREFDDRIEKCGSGDESDIMAERDDYILRSMPYLQTAAHIPPAADRVEIDLKAMFDTRASRTVRRGELYSAFMADVENAPPPRDAKGTAKTVTCPECGGYLVFIVQTHEHTCRECGAVAFNELNEAPAYNDTRISVKTTTFTYKRENHFNEWLSQLESTNDFDVPCDVMDRVRGEFKRQRIADGDTITHHRMRGMLKKLGLNQYYDIIPALLKTFNGGSALVIDDDTRHNLHYMFSEVHRVFHHNAPSTRKNFFSYPYILYKFCELLGADHILPHLHLLKSKEKLHQQDLIFRKICKELRWEFIPTV